MSERFTASNGLPVIEKEWGFSLTKGIDLGVMTGVTNDQADALRQFFQHERDQELGRWRWPENPDYVVYLSEGGEAVWVLNERKAGMVSFTREMSTPTGDVEGEYNDAARAYFAAHPEPKPWHAAEPGEVWLIRRVHYDGEIAVGVFEFDGEPHFSIPGQEDISCATDRVFAARRIWPEKD